MATKKETTDALRATWTKELMDFVGGHDTDVCQTAAGTFMFPVVDAAGDDRWIKVSVIVPKDAEEESGTDGYSLAHEYQLKLDKAAARKLEAEQKSAARKAKKDATAAKLDKWENQ